MAKVKWRAREFNPTANMEGRRHSFYAEAVINSDLSNDDLAQRIQARTGFKAYEVQAVIAANVLFIAIIWVLEAVGMSNRKSQKIITYEKIALIRPDRREELLADLRERTGLDIVKVQVGSIDFLKDTAFLKVTYLTDDPEPNDIEMVTKFKKK